jgi:hypothetical protein
MSVVGSGVTNVFSTPLTSNSTTALERLGAIRFENDDVNGEKIYMYVRTSTAVANGNTVKLTTTGGFTVGTDTTNAAVTTVRKRAAGVGIGAITSGNYGWILVRGYHSAILVSAESGKSSAAGVECVCGCGGSYALSIGAATAKSGAVANGIFSYEAKAAAAAFAGYVNCI